MPFLAIVDWCHMFYWRLFETFFKVARGYAQNRLGNMKFSCLKIDTKSFGHIEKVRWAFIYWPNREHTYLEAFEISWRLSTCLLVEHLVVYCDLILYRGAKSVIWSGNYVRHNLFEFNRLYLLWWSTQAQVERFTVMSIFRMEVEDCIHGEKLIDCSPSLCI